MAKSASKMANDNYRNEVVKFIKEQLINLREEDVQQVATNKLAFPCTNELNEDLWIEITIAIPSGSRKDNAPYDGYEQAQDFKIKEAEAKEKAEQQAIAKAKKIERDKKAREIAKKGKGGE